jgi:Xaa-Pro aminopeptidase
MPFASSLHLASRVSRLRALMEEVRLPALLVTHLPNVRYLTNLSASAAACLVEPDRVALVTDFRYGESARRLIDEGVSAPGCDLTIVRSTYDETIVGLLKDLAGDRFGVEAAHLTLARSRWLEAHLAAAGDPAKTLVPTERLIERLRVVKDDHEVAALCRAARLLSSVAQHLRPAVRAGLRELEVAAWIDSALKTAGFTRYAFDTIVASGPNGAHPHARAGERRLATGDLVVLDFGGVYDGYCVDLTRTFALGEPSGEARRVHAAVLAAQRAAIAAVRPGVRASDVDRAARDVLSHAGLGEAFGHGTGHGLGLEIHEEPRIAAPNQGRDDDVALEPGMVFTVEPGAYLPGWGGVRIEDDVLVTDTGCEVLTEASRDL